MEFTLFTIPLDIVKLSWLAFGLVLIYFAIISIVLIFHWIAYGYSKTATSLMGLIYFAGSGTLITIAFFALILFNP